jgi:four helix bundle protein
MKDSKADCAYGNDLSRRTLEFAIRLIALVDALPKSRAADVIGRQLLRSGTSIGANYREAQRAESRDDFIHKTAISSKEAAETEYWLELIAQTKQLASNDAEKLLIECRELIAILLSIGKKAKANK